MDEFAVAQGWASLLLAALSIGLFMYLGTRVRSVPDGYVAIIERRERFARVAMPGHYLLRPFEREVARVYIRQREMTATVTVPNLFTEAGVPVSATLRYAYRLDPRLMTDTEIYYSDDARAAQQQTLVRQALQAALSQVTPTPRVTPERGSPFAATLDPARMFSPFAGAKARALQMALDAELRKTLRGHGIVLTAAPVTVEGLQIPPDVAEAYSALIAANFGAHAREDLVRRLSQELPDLTAAEMGVLLKLLKNPPAELRRLLSGDPPASGATPADRVDLQPSPDQPPKAFVLRPPLERLNGDQVGRLQAALASAFRNRDQLRQMVRIHLDEGLDTIAGGATVLDVIFNLIDWAQSEGLVTELIEGAVNTKPGNPDLKAFVASLPGQSA